MRAGVPGPRQGYRRDNLEGGRGDRFPPMWTVDTIFVKNMVLLLQLRQFAPGISGRQTRVVGHLSLDLFFLTPIPDFS